MSIIPIDATASGAGGGYVATAFVGMYAPLGDASRHCVHGQDRSVIPEQDKQSGAMLKLLHGLRRVHLRRRPDERVKIFRHGDVSNDSETQFLPQLGESHNPLLPKTPEIKSVS